MKNRIVLVFLVLVIVFATGCVDARYHLTVNRDGSGDIDVTIAFSDLALMMLRESGNDPLPQLADQFRENGFTISNFKDGGKTGFVARKEVEQFSGDELGFVRAGHSAIASAAPGPEDALSIQRGWFTTAYTVRTQVDPMSFAQIPELNRLDSYLINQVNFEFVLTLPIEPDGHNAKKTEDEGKTLIWQLLPGQQNTIEVEASHINPVGIGVTAFAALALAGGLAYVLVKRKGEKE